MAAGRGENLVPANSVVSLCTKSDGAAGSEGACMESKFGRDVMPFVFMAIFVGGLIVLAITGH
jgi:hypothetical protein